ncbi:hypothetical protein IIA15_04085, partial [candidate division TA06 bacterium]|nr:hypothetical protein [candidate division TA06 bacterium]
MIEGDGSETRNRSRREGIAKEVLVTLGGFLRLLRICSNGGKGKADQKVQEEE